jgi:pimeloyl-ACP methyl ester carboxylesterase
MTHGPAARGAQRPGRASAHGVNPRLMTEEARLDDALGPIDWSLWPPEAESSTFAAPSGPLAMVSMGPADGARIVLVPGMTGSKEDFVLMMPLLAAGGYRVESFDMSGQYESAAAGPENLDPPGGRYTLDLFVDDLRAVLSAGRTPAHVLGYSFAGTVASVLAIARPDLFASLTLLSAPPLSGQSLRGFKWLGPISPLVPGRALGPAFISALRHNVHGARADRAQFVTARLDYTRSGSVGDMLALMKRTPDLDAALRATGIPLLVVTGASDVFPTELHHAYANRLGARFVVLPTGHSPCETAPNQVTRAMRELIER